MKFLNLEIENFLAITQASVTLNDRGLVLIEGVNEDDTSAKSNGAGKSTIADALAWVLFGVTAREESGDNVINDTAKKGCRVSISLDDAGTLYTITRHRKHKTGKNAVHLFQQADDPAKPPIDLTAGTDKLTQEKIGKILGCSYDVFVASVYAAQEKVPDLPAMTDKNLKILVEEAAGVTLLEEAYEEARERLRAADAELKTAQTKLLNYENGIEDGQESIARLESQLETWSDRQKTDVQSLTREALRIKAERDAAQADFTQIDYAAIVNAIAAEQGKIDAVDGERTRLDKLNVGAMKAQNAVSLKEQGVRNIKAEYDRLRQEITDVGHKVGCDCSACGRPITEAEIEGTKRNLVETARKRAAEFTEAQAALVTARAEAEKLTSERDAFKASMTDLSSTVASLRRYEGEKADADTKKAKAERLARDFQSKAVELKRRKEEVNPIVPLVEEAKKNLRTVIEGRDKAKKAVEELEAKKAIADSVAKVFSPAGVRAHILDEVTPFLNGQTAKYLGTLSDGNITATWSTLVANAKGELREKFSIEVENAKGSKTFKGLSGGEKRKVRIAAALALQDLVARRASKPIELFIGDEIDDALDAAGRERLTMILDEKAKDRGTVFLISHGEMKDWISQQIRVTKKAGGQTIVDEVMA